MSKYIINRNPQLTWEHEVHNEDTCTHLPLNTNRVTLWNFINCDNAITFAKKELPKLEIDWCYWCTSCHTR
jgi:hypothetical protein